MTHEQRRLQHSQQHVEQHLQLQHQAVELRMVSDFRPDLMAGKVLVITGGATGIGFGICQGFGRHGAKVVLCGRRQDALDEACGKLRGEGIACLGVTCDVRDAARCEFVIAEALRAFGKVDFLVNNAAGNFSTTIENLSTNGFKTVLDIDTVGSFNMSKAALPALKANGGGVIIHTTATLHYKSMPFQMAASAAKAAIDTMTNNMAIEWGEYNIRVVSIAPGPIENTVGGPTGRVFGEMMKKAPSAASKNLYMQVPIGRFGTVEDIANTALFVCSPSGSFINATSVVVDGGQWHQASGVYLMAKDHIAKASQRERGSHKGGVAAGKAKL